MDDTAQTKLSEEQPEQLPENYEPQSLKKVLLKGFFLGILLVVVVGTIAFFLLNSANKQATSVLPKPTPTKTQANKNAWKIYKDPKVQFTFTYPNDWYIETTATFTSVPNKYSSWLTVLTDSKTFTDPNQLIPCSNAQDSSKACLNNSGTNSSDIDQSPINGYQAKSFYEGGQGDLALHVVQIDGPNGQQVELSTSVFVEGTDAIFSKILSTFKFTNAQQLSLVGNFIWNVPANTLSPDFDKNLKTTFAEYKLPKNYQDLISNTSNHLSVDEIRTSTESADFATAEITYRDHNNTIIPTDGNEFYLQKENGTWEIFAAGEANFCQNLKYFPNDLMDESSYHDYYGCP